MSLRSPKHNRFSRQGFQPIDQPGMAHNDATIDIPLEDVNTQYTGGALGNQSSVSAIQPTQTQNSSGSAKRSLFRGRRVKTPQGGHGKGTGRVGYDGEEDTVNTMGKIYQKIMDFSIITRYLVYVIPVGALIAVPIIVGALLPKDHEAKIGGVSIVWFFSWVEIMWASVWASKLVAHYLPFIFRIFAGVVSSGVRKYSAVIQSLEIPLSLVGWAVTSLATFMPIMTRNPTNVREKDTDPKHWEYIVQKILAAATIASLIYLGEKLIIQLISIDYHRKQFTFRIKESKHNVYLLGLLYEASRKLFPMYCNEFAEEDYTITDQLNISLNVGSGKGRSHARSGSATPMRFIHDIGRYGDKITSAFGNVAHEITGKEVFNPNSAHSIVVEALERKKASEALARRIWMSFVVEGRDALSQEDIMDVLGADRRTEAEEAFAALDADGNGDVSLDEMIMTVTEISRERKSIASSMHDVDQAINVLDNLLSVVVFIAVVFVFVAFLNANFTTTLATTGTALLSLSFVFSVTCQEVLGSCIFVFVKHPFDVGDRIDIGPDQFIVEHISLLFCVFRRTSGANMGRIVQIPNIILNTQWVENISRSKAMSEQIEVDVFFGTSFEDIQLLKNELTNFVTDKENSRDFLPQVEIGILGTTDQSKLALQIEIRHKSNWANETVRQARRSKFMCALVLALKKVPIDPPGGNFDPLGVAANPSYAVTVTDEIAKRNAAESAKAKEAARMIPTKKIEEAKNALSPTSSGKSGAAGMTKSENKIVDNLTHRDPTDDLGRDEAWTSSRDDSSTLGERPSIDPQDLEEVKGLLRRESTRGKRKPDSEPSRMQAPSVPTINEPTNTYYADYGQPSASGYGQPSTGGYENQKPSQYWPTSRNQPTQYQSAQSQLPTGQTSPVEMRQVARSPSNPYRTQRSESITRKPITPAAGGGNLEDDEFGNTRPYSGV